VQTRPRGDRARYLKLARTNAATALATSDRVLATFAEQVQTTVSFCH
jgi:excinuclease ABC subunit C